MITASYVLIFGLIAFGLTPAMGLNEWEEMDPEWAQNQSREIYNFTPFKQKELAPDFCIMVPQPSIPYSQYENSVIHGIKVWQEGLEKMSAWKNPEKGVSWEMNIIIIPYEEHKDKTASDFIQCNVFILFEEINEENSKTLGQAAFNWSKSSHQHAYITIWTMQERIIQNLDPNPDNWKPSEVVYEYIKPNTMRQIITHEVGHALGLGHYFAGFSPSRSVMEYSMSTWNETYYIPPQMLDYYALIMKYGWDGFKVWELGAPEGTKCLICPAHPSYTTP